MLGLIWARNFWLTDWLWELLWFIFTKFLFISIIYLRSVLFESFILFILMFFGQVSHTTMSFTWRIVRTMSFLISITFVVNLIPKRLRCLFRTTFFYISKINLFCPFPWVDWLFNILFSNDRSVWSFLSFILERNTKNIWCYTW